MSKTLRIRKNGAKVYRIKASRARVPVTGQVPTFSQYAETFIEQIMRIRSENTVLSYRRVLARSEGVWGKLRITDITKTMVKAYVAGLQEHYKYKSVCLHFDLLKNAFRTAVEDEVIPFSPMQTLRKPAQSKDARQDETDRAYTEEELRYILRCMKNEKLEYEALVYLIADSGCRRGEVCGLTWKCVDLDTGEVCVRYNAQYFPGDGVKILAPKSGKTRRIFLNPEALRKLQAWKKDQEIWCARRGIPPCKYCFNNSSGGVMNPATLTALFRIWGKKYGITGFRPHKLRHTMATISISNGADVISVSNKLGHSTPSITLDVYSHGNEEAQRRANQALARAIYYIS